jgi:hypothetical protein
MLANTKTINDNVNFGSVYERNGFSLPAQTQCGTFSHSRTNGCDSTYYLNLTVLPTLAFTSPDTCEVDSICSGFAATYYPTSDPSSTNYTWTRAAVAGITEPAGSGSGDINEVLTNTTDNPITVTYVVTATVNGCTNTKNVTVVVKPKKTPSITIKVKTD